MKSSPAIVPSLGMLIAVIWRMLLLAPSTATYCSRHHGMYPSSLYKELLRQARTAPDRYTRQLMQALLDAPHSISKARAPYTCQAGANDTFIVRPTGFSLPIHRIMATVPAKSKVFSTVVPDVFSTYKFRTSPNDSTEKIMMAEILYNRDMSNSLFAITFKKGGWDCLRHLEILAAGCLPLFTDIADLPRGTMAAHPVEVYDVLRKWPGLMLRGIQGTARGPTMVRELTTPVNETVYQLATQALLDVTRHTLTTHSMARYVMNAIRATTSHRILYITWPKPQREYWKAQVDYMDSLLHGFITLMRDNVVDYPRRGALYQTPDTFNETFMAKSKSKLYGKGFGGFAYGLFEAPGTVDRSNIEGRIKSKQFDYVIFGLAHREEAYALFSMVCSSYTKDQVVFVFGHDQPPTSAQMKRAQSCSNFLFSREMPFNCNPMPGNGTSSS